MEAFSNESESANIIHQHQSDGPPVYALILATDILLQKAWKRSAAFLVWTPVRLFQVGGGVGNPILTVHRDVERFAVSTRIVWFRNNVPSTPGLSMGGRFSRTLNKTFPIEAPIAPPIRLSQRGQRRYTLWSIGQFTLTMHVVHHHTGAIWRYLQPFAARAESFRVNVTAPPMLLHRSR